MLKFHWLDKKSHTREEGIDQAATRTEAATRTSIDYLLIREIDQVSRLCKRAEEIHQLSRHLKWNRRKRGEEMEVIEAVQSDRGNGCEPGISAHVVWVSRSVW
ncbi:hypothetical protein LXL04_007625 [Taraxacum kok-saghyz]